MFNRLPAWRFVTLAALGFSIAGCVERRMVVLTDPPTATAYDEKNQPIGATPADKPFIYYGTYHFKFTKDGYETLVVQQKVDAPWYEWPGLDFVSENLIPWTIRDVRYFKYTMQPSNLASQAMTPELLLQQAQQLRDYGATKGTAPPPPIVPPGQ